jgi:ABC-type multidrug transport system fused ATPase/permease subunit
MKALLYASITKFYNRVPIGRILNRLSKDLREIDESLGFAVGNIFVCFFSALGSLVMCLYASTMIVMVPIVGVGMICFWLLKYYLKSMRECVRLENITNSPIVSGFTSAVNGVATIRSYGLCSKFLQHQIERV